MSYIVVQDGVILPKHSSDAISSMLGLLVAEIQVILYRFTLLIFSFLFMKFSLKFMKLKIISFLYQTLGS